MGTLAQAPLADGGIEAPIGSSMGGLGCAHPRRHSRLGPGSTEVLPVRVHERVPGPSAAQVRCGDRLGGLPTTPQAGLLLGPPAPGAIASLHFLP